MLKVNILGSLDPLEMTLLETSQILQITNHFADRYIGNDSEDHNQRETTRDSHNIG